MGLLGGLFGRTKDRRSPATDRCMECGMTGGDHTDWCPTLENQEEERAPAARSGPSDAPPEEAAPAT